MYQFYEIMRGGFFADTVILDNLYSDYPTSWWCQQQYIIQLEESKCRSGSQENPFGLGRQLMLQ